MSRNHKVKALFLILLSFTLTITLAPIPPIGKLSLVLLALVLMLIVARLPESVRANPTKSTADISTTQPVKDET